MTIWIDAQLSPYLAPCISERFAVTAVAVRDLGLQHAADSEIFFAAKREQTIVMTKDVDFLRLLDLHGPPPQVIWVTCGNTSNARLCGILD